MVLQAVMMMPIGDNRFSKVGNDFSTLLDLNGTMVNVTRTVQADITNTNIFSEPTDYTPDKFQAKVLVIDKSMDETAVIAGGKPKEVLRIISASGTFIEEDDISYCTHSYNVKNIEQLQLGGINELDICDATREVEV